MNQATQYPHSHREYLFGLSEQTRPSELDQFETTHLDFYEWSQKEHGPSPEQGQPEIDEFNTIRRR